VEAIILCGGLGTRLRPVVADRPKPLAPVQGRPFLHYLISELKKSGIDRLILAVSYLHEQIMNCCGNGAAFGAVIQYAVEPVRLGTAGAVKQAARLGGAEDFLVLNGDTYAQLDYLALVAEHLRQQADLTMALHRSANTERYGRVELDVTGQIVSFAEKSSEMAGEPLINAGVYVMNRRILSLIPGQRKLALETELLPQLLQMGRKIYGYRTTGYFRDIGLPEDYYQFSADVAAGLIP
jgi:D-glycero-alpha-D-manno-heptose 1-phosphate guanylyltransferase